MPNDWHSYDDLEWEDPPSPPVGLPNEALAFSMQAQAMRDNPGRWLRLTEYERTHHHTARMMVTRIQHARLAAFKPAGSFKSCSRLDREADVVVVYAKYEGRE